MASARTPSKWSIVFADPPTSAKYHSAEVPMDDLNNEIMDVTFVKAVDFYNYPGGMKGMSQTTGSTKACFLVTTGDTSISWIWTG